MIKELKDIIDIGEVQIILSKKNGLYVGTIFVKAGGKDLSPISFSSGSVDEIEQELPQVLKKYSEQEYSTAFKATVAEKVKDEKKKTVTPKVEEKLKEPDLFASAPIPAKEQPKPTISIPDEFAGMPVNLPEEEEATTELPNEEEDF